MAHGLPSPLFAKGSKHSQQTHHHEAVQSLFEGPGHDGRVDPAGAHDANDLDVGRVLQSGNSSQVSGGVPSPRTAECEYLRGKVVGHYQPP